MTEFWIMDITDKTDIKFIRKESCPGNAAELRMILEEINPGKKFSVERIEILEKVD